MTAPRILVREDAKARARAGAEPAPQLGWYLLGGLGLVFAVVGGLDILLAWYPPDFANLEWKFGTVTTTLNSMPLLTVGVVLLTGSAMARGRKGLMKTMAVILLVLLVVVLGCAILYIPQISPALAKVNDPTVQMGLKRAILKTNVQWVSYSIILGWIAWLTIRHTRVVT